MRQIAPDFATYHHIEPACHDVVMAEGVAAETFLDADNRDAFASEPGVVRLHPDFAPPAGHAVQRWEALGCAPLVVTGPPVERARAMLQARERVEPLSGGAAGAV